METTSDPTWRSRLEATVQRYGWLFPALLVVALYAQVWDHVYIEFDDMYYTYENPVVSRGLSWDGVIWAFSGSHVANYHPLTWLSHMLDFELFGNRPGVFALENAGLHAINTLLVGVFVGRLLGSGSLGLAAGLIFACHPKLVEAVAWISQRKTLLSTLFALATLLAYLKARESERKAGWYTLSLILYALSLLAKAMYVTMPGMLLVLEWILASERRASSLWHDRAWLRVMGRLIPFAGLALIISVATYHAQAQDHAVHSVESLPLDMRASTAIVGTATYLRHFVYPLGLSIFYPLPDAWSSPMVLTSAMVILGITVGLALVRKRIGTSPILGWALFLGMLAPVIGIVQVGAQASADRYFYGPILGLIITGLTLMRSSRRFLRRSLVRAGLCAFTLWLVFAAAVAYRQIGYWSSSYRLALASEDSIGPHPQLLSVRATTLLRLGRYEDVIRLCRQALDQEPSHLTSLQNLAVAEFALGNAEEAIRLSRIRIQLAPDLSGAYTNLALFLARTGRRDEAVEVIQAARKLDNLTASELKLLSEIEAEIGTASRG